MNIVMIEWSFKLLQIFNVDIIKLYISVLGHARKLKFSCYINKLFQYRHAWVILCSVGEVYILNLGAIFQLWDI